MTKQWLKALTLLGFLGLSASCEDGLSTIGEGIQTRKDVVESEKHFLQFEATTVEAPTLYIGRATTGLVGAYSDPVYGDFMGDFATQLRTAPGFKFAQTPHNGQIDSVVLRLVFSASQSTDSYVGAPQATMEFSVFELPASFSGSETSSTSLRSYADPSKLLAEQVLSVAGNRVLQRSQAGDSVYYLPIKLKQELGQRIYDASVNSPQHFATQESFNANVLGGLYITPTTGRGAVLKVLATNMVIHYRYQSADTLARTSESFINTKLTAHADGITSQSTAELLSPSTTHTYSKGPAGVQTAITLKKEQMQRLLARQANTIKIGDSWTLSDTQLRLTVDNPSGMLLNPPRYMMLMPADSVSTYFKKGHTERTAAATSYLSTMYSSNAAYYDFFNISRMLTEHLKRHAKYEGGAWVVERDLDLRLLPVERYMSSSSSGTPVTTAIEEYIFPSFVRLKKDEAALKIGVVSSIFR